MNAKAYFKNVARAVLARTPPPGKATQKELIRAYERLLKDLEQNNKYNAFTPGRVDWSEKWNKCVGKRILYFTATDFSGSFYKWAEAVNRHTDHAVRVANLRRHRFGHPVDLLYARGAALKAIPKGLNGILQLADEADIIHIKDQTGFMDSKNGLPPDMFTQFKKPLAYTLYGGHARRDENVAAFRYHVGSHDAIIAMTPDLCFDWCESVFIPHNIDEDQNPYAWRDDKIALHTPSTPSRKGTEFFEPAGLRLEREMGVSARIVTGVTHEDVMREKPLATIFFDQAGRESEENGGKLIGWYGNSALEAAVYGVPTMAHLSQEAIDRAGRAGYDVDAESAILNVHPSEESLYRTMREFFERSSSERENLSRATRDWIEKHHSYRATADKLSKLYAAL